MKILVNHSAIINGNTNPISTYLANQVEHRLTYAYRKAANDVDAKATIYFEFDEEGGVVTLMRLIFQVKSWGIDVLKYEDYLQIFETVCQKEFNSTKIKLTYIPGEEAGQAIYEAKIRQEMLALLEAFESVGVSIDSTFRLEGMPFRERNNIARVGFFGEEGKFEVYIMTDDECPKPHFHVRNIFSGTDTSILLKSNSYCFHERRSCRELSEEEQQLLADFMAGPHKNPHYKNNYEYTYTMWNMNNQEDCIVKSTDAIPDYAHITHIEYSYK